MDARSLVVDLLKVMQTRLIQMAVLQCHRVAVRHRHLSGEEFRSLDTAMITADAALPVS